MFILQADVPTLTNGGGFLLAVVLVAAVCLTVAALRVKRGVK